ncbi:SRPBCC family protein [Flexithrix dorotheae]|uniref:SRPBCC family protein n=1 Tax=Flexithrix dorotheae TaxID=70993 RepID=UPI00036796C0|nr:SRPBCC family protein [Flexithrix dorotheae]
MHYTNEVIIEVPIEKVISLFDNPDNLKKWQPGLQSFEHISGDYGQPGAKSRLKYMMGKREIEMIETIITRNLPQEFTGTYETKGVFNKVSNKFIPIEGNKTKYIAENEFQFTGLMMKLFGFFMPGAFKKQSQEYLDLFKNFAEKEAANN